VFQGVITLVSQGAIALVIWYGSTLIAANELDIASLIAFMLYSITIAASVAGLSSVFGTVMQAVGASTRVFELMDRKPQIPVLGGLPLAPGDGIISLEDVSFAYPSRKETEVLKGQVDNRAAAGALLRPHARAHHAQWSRLARA
jgi:ABC-type multidrug transport system fused ATPase/permease subunit